MHDCVKFLFSQSIWACQGRARFEYLKRVEYSPGTEVVNSIHSVKAVKGAKSQSFAIIKD